MPIPYPDNEDIYESVNMRVTRFIKQKPHIKIDPDATLKALCQYLISSEGCSGIKMVRPVLLDGDD